MFQVAELNALTRGVARIGSSQLMPRMHYYFFEKGQPMSGFEYQTHLGIMEDYKTQWVKYCRKYELDFIISPGFGSQAFLHGKS